MADYLKTYGAIGGFTLTQRSRSFNANSDYGHFPYVPTTPFPTVVYVLTLTKGPAVTDVALEAAADPINLGGSSTLDRQAKVILDAFAAIGAQVVLGDPAAPVIANPNGTGAYTRAVDLVPGTPLPPGRGVRVYGTGAPIKLKLAGGGTIPASDATGGGGTIIGNVAVVDVVTPLPTDAKVQILY